MVFFSTTHERTEETKLLVVVREMEEGRGGRGESEREQVTEGWGYLLRGVFGYFSEDEDTSLLWDCPHLLCRLVQLEMMGLCAGTPTPHAPVTSTCSSDPTYTLGYMYSETPEGHLGGTLKASFIQRRFFSRR